MRAKILLVALIALALTASPAAADTFTVDGLGADTYGRPANGRVFFFHQLAGTRDHATNYPAFVDGLVARGYQVISTDEPYDHAAPNQSAALRAAFTDGVQGQSYRDQWATDTHDLIAAANARYGAAPRTLMAGVSWGGYSALLAACSNPEVDGYAVTIPAVDPNGLPEWADLPLENLKLWNQGCATRLASIPGYLSWGNADTRVGTSGTRRLLPLLGASVTNCEYPTGHEVPAFTIAGMLRWVDGARDCLPYTPAAPPAAPKAAPASTGAAPVAAPASPAPAASPTAPEPPRTATGRRCNRANHCENIVRRHRLFHVYNRRSRHPRWVYVRPAASANARAGSRSRPQRTHRSK